MGNKNKGGREAKKPKKSAKLKGAPVTSTVHPGDQQAAGGQAEVVPLALRTSTSASVSSDARR